MSCIQQNFPSKFEPNDAFYEKLEQNTFVAFILRHPVVKMDIVWQSAQENLYQCYSREEEWYEIWIRSGFELRTHGFESYFLIEPYP